MREGERERKENRKKREETMEDKKIYTPSVSIRSDRDIGRVSSLQDIIVYFVSQ
jgi:hypothetical protein